MLFFIIASCERTRLNEFAVPSLFYFNDTLSLAAEERVYHYESDPIVSSPISASKLLSNPRTSFTTLEGGSSVASVAIPMTLLVALEGTSAFASTEIYL